MKLLNTILLFALLLLISSPLLSQKKLTVEKLNWQINTPNYDEISPVLSIDGKTMYYTRVGSPDFDKTLIEMGEDISQNMPPQEYKSHLQKIFSRLAQRSINSPVQSGFNQDIWVAECDLGIFDKVQHPSYPLNNAMPNSICSLTPASNELIVINQFGEGGGMQAGFSLVRRQSDGRWSFPESIQVEDFYTTGPDVSLTMSNDGKVIIMSLKRRDSRGENDLYISYRQGKYNWTRPQNMGTKINSSARDITPYLSEDNKALFFASNRSGSLGGTDIYVAERLGESWTDWTYPQRFNEPVNSVYDDSKPYFNATTGFMYFTSKRDGSSDIFRSQLSPPNPITVTIRGKIVDSKTNKPVGGNILVGTGDEAPNKVIYVSDDGTYELNIPKGVRLTLQPESPGYDGRKQKVHFEKTYVYYKDYNVNLLLDPLEIGSKIELDPVYFERSKPVILSQSYAVLDKLAIFLKENYNIAIRIEGHTDDQGEESSLIKLSEDRAEAVKEYLVYKKFINPLRIETIGFGGSVPAVENSTEDSRSKNRRVEVQIVKITKLYDDSSSD